MPPKTVVKDTMRKNKRRFNLENKVKKISTNFLKDKDIHYKNKLTSLQTDLTTLHQGTNSTFLRGLHDLEEERDMELIRLRLFEEYRVSRSSIEFQEDIEKAKSDHEKLIQLCKEKLYFNIEQKIKKLQEEKLLMDVANIHSYSMDYSRPLIYQKNTRSHTVSGNNNGWGSSSNEFTTNDSATDMGNERRSLRRRIMTKEGNKSTNDLELKGNNSDATDESDFKTSYYSASGTNISKNRTSKKHSSNNNNNGNNNINNNNTKSDINSDAEFLKEISDYADLQQLLFGEKEESKETNSKNKKKHRINPRYSTKSAPPLQSLTSDEVAGDIDLIRELTGQLPSPFKIYNAKD